MSASPPDERASPLLDRGLIDDIKRVERATGRNDVLSGFVRTLEGNLAGFGAAFSDYLARGDTAGAKRAAHTLKGACHQLGAKALGDLFQGEQTAHSCRLLASGATERMAVLALMGNTRH